LIIFLIPVGLAQAEVGKNFDTVDLGNGLTQWTSHYDRIWDGDSWENYLISNNPIQLEFESGNISFLFDKVSCDFKLLDPESKGIAIEQYDFTLNIDGLPTVLPICNLESFIQSEDRVSFTINRGLFKTLYDMNPSGSMEWTHEIDNNEGKATTYTIIETCTDCIVQSIDGNRIDFGFYTLDTKNEIHGTVKETRADKGDYIIQYEKTILDREKLIIDPSFGYTITTYDAYVSSTLSIGATCNATAGVNSTSAVITVPNSGSNGSCRRAAFEWDISSIPDNADIIDVRIRYDVNSVTYTDSGCDWHAMEKQPSVSTNQVFYDDAKNGTEFVAASTQCTTVTNDKILDLGSSADADLQANLPDDWWAVGISYASEARPGSAGSIGFTDNANELLVTWNPLQDAVDDLVATDIRGTAVDLSWTQPALNGATFHSYQVNSTTPWSSNVASISNNSTVSTSVTVTSLTGETQYSFRVGLRTTDGGINASGNVVNVTTDFDPTGSFTPGTFNLTGSGTDVREIKYIRDDIDDTSLFLNITADNDFNLACNFHYKFANTNQTYTSIANTSINANEDMASFRFNNVTNEIIDVLCWDQYTNASARYLITITDFPLLQQIADFKAGEFGTLGMFGALDFISLIVVIFAMVGFNRVNETVGVVLGLFIVGGLAVLSNGLIISWATTFTAGFAVVIMWAIATTRKD
jgi:hypothetical protein